MDNHLGGKKTCKYYSCCGNVENCRYCLGYEKKSKSKSKKYSKK